MKQLIFTFLSVILLQQILWSQNISSGQVAYWKMDGNFNDAGPSGIHGTSYNAITTTNNSNAANFAMAFNNPSSTVDQYATHPINASLNFNATQDFSIDFYVYFNSPFVHTGGIYDNNLNYGGPGIWFWNPNGYTQIQFIFKNNSIGTTNGAIALGVWQHITAIRSGNAIMIYVNGVLNVSGTVGSTNPVYNFPGRIGSMFYNGFTPPQYNGLNGKIDELRIYNRTVTQAEINQLQVLLPVQLTNFNAQLIQNNALLKWQTAQEQNAKNFTIQRSINGTLFENIGTVLAAGNSTIIQNYQFNDDVSALNYNKIYYRLVQNDLNGNSKTSNIIFVQKLKIKNTLVVYPNPAVGQIHANAYFAKQGKSIIKIIDNTGKIILLKNDIVQQGSNSITIDARFLQKGNYILHIASGEEIFTEKIIIQ